MKVCSKCKVEKEDSEFRLKFDKRRKTICYYLNNICFKCEAENTRERTKRQRQTKEGREKHNKWAREGYWRRRDKCLIEAKKYRSRPEVKERRKEYIKENKDKIFAQETISKRRYHEKHRDNITDTYAINLLRTQGMGTVDEIKKQPELIELKKVQVLKKRIRLEILKKEKHG